MSTNNKSNLRVPRASNLTDLKNLISTSQEKQYVDELLNLDKSKKKTHLIEYLKLLEILDLIKQHDSLFVVTKKGRDIKSNLSKTESLNQNDIEILKNIFLKLEIVKTFLVNVFNFDATTMNYPTEKCLSKEEIYERYLLYREVSVGVAERESRIIYNWLLNLETIGSFKNISDDNRESTVCYSIVGKHMGFDEFSKKIKSSTFKAMKNSRQKSAWVEIPKVRNLFCIQNNILKSRFDELFVKYVIKNPFSFQLGTGSFLRKEVENEGIYFKDKLYFYIKLTMGVDDG